MATTGEEIAKIAGCSASTVSRVLNNSAPVSQQVREAVLTAIREQGVVPRSRVRRRGNGATDLAEQSSPKPTGLVEVVMHLTTAIEHLEVTNGEVKLGPIAQCPPDRFFRPENRYCNSHFRRIIDGVMDELARAELRGAIRTVGSLEGGRLLTDINAPGVGGLILLGNGGPTVEPFLRRCKCPVVSFIGVERSGWPPSVGCDDLPGFREAVQHLVSLGHKRIGYMAGLQDVPGFRDRLAAFKLAMIEAGLPIHPDFIYTDSTHIADIAVAADRMLSAVDRPTAILCCYDSAAIGVMQAAKRHGLVVPNDLSVIGFGNQEITDILRPALTTINSLAYEMGRAAVKLLRLQQMEPGSGEGISIRLRTSLVVRASTAPAR